MPHDWKLTVRRGRKRTNGSKGKHARAFRQTGKVLRMARRRWMRRMKLALGIPAYAHDDAPRDDRVLRDHDRLSAGDDAGDLPTHAS